ncbi:leucine zipper transcription factor-like protein 1 isoform X3 [Montipora capricornis]|uniref:leucine zipper transcription factor-like protein 1 isoform X3 n=1 Tax=Montipora capricornis TaxID=246305 RepID=UPI0035F1F9AA
MFDHGQNQNHDLQISPASLDSPMLFEEKFLQLSLQKKNSGLPNCKHEILKLQHDLEEAEKDLAKKFNETTQYRNMKQMLTSKNEQLKDLRSRLRKYEPDA